MADAGCVQSLTMRTTRTASCRELAQSVVLARIFHTFQRRVRARGLQRRRTLVGRVPSRGALLFFQSECEICRLDPARAIPTWQRNAGCALEVHGPTRIR